MRFLKKVALKRTMHLHHGVAETQKNLIFAFLVFSVSL